MPFAFWEVRRKTTRSSYLLSEITFRHFKTSPSCCSSRILVENVDIYLGLCLVLPRRGQRTILINCFFNTVLHPRLTLKPFDSNPSSQSHSQTRITLTPSKRPQINPISPSDFPTKSGMHLFPRNSGMARFLLSILLHAQRRTGMPSIADLPQNEQGGEWTHFADE